MSFEDLFSTAAAARHDDAPRRVYADALVEKGDPLGEFIHVQCDLAAGGLPRDEALRRRRRERELLKANEERWTAGLARFAHDFRFVRGFVDKLTLSAEDWAARGQELFAAAPALREVTLTGLWERAYDNGGSEKTARLVLRRLEDALASPLFGRLEGLGYHPVGYVVPDPIWELSESIGANPSEQTVSLETEALERLLAADLSQLRSLSTCLADEQALDRLAAAPVLKRLERFELMHGDADASRVIAALDPARLRVLGLREWNDGIARFPALKELKLKWSRRSLGRLSPGLTRLACAPTSENFEALSACPQLVELELNTASMQQYRELARFPVAQRLEVLRIPRATDAEVAELQALFGCLVEVRW